MADGHIKDEDLKAVHQDRDGGGSKGCLTRHQRRDNGNACSHQWQAYLKAQDDSWRYDVHDRPRWSVDMPGNFQHFRRPYWHNAHHIIPNGSLKNAIASTGEDNADIPRLIEIGLCKAEYNLNDKINMVILPMERSVAARVGLPRHLKGDDVSPGEKPEKFSHKDYSNRIENEVKSALSEIKQTVANALNKTEGTHDVPNFTLSKKKLEQLSRSVYDGITTAGLVGEGEALADESMLESILS